MYTWRAKMPHTPMMTSMLKTADPTMVPTPTSPSVINTPAIKHMNNGNNVAEELHWSLLKFHILHQLMLFQTCINFIQRTQKDSLLKNVSTFFWRNIITLKVTNWKINYIFIWTIFSVNKDLNFCPQWSWTVPGNFKSIIIYLCAAFFNIF